MQAPEERVADPDLVEVAPPERYVPKTPLLWRLYIAVGLTALFALAWVLRDTIGLRGQSLVGVVFFFGIVALFSSNLRAVSWRTIGFGIGLQLLLALLVLQGKVTINETEYSVYGAFEMVGDAVKALIDCSDQGAKFVFGDLAGSDNENSPYYKKVFFVFAFRALPPILFVSALFTVLYHYGILQVCVRALAKVMTYLMRTSGAETLSVAANVFMGQTEAPLIVRPFVPRMTKSELFALMASGMAHISGGLMAVYISYGANPVAVLTTCIMACPCSLYLSKLFYPELGRPVTGGQWHPEKTKSPYVNAIDAAAAGTSDGLQLALNVGAMLIVFIAFVALFNSLLGLVPTQCLAWTGWELPKQFSLEWIFGKLFAPVAFLMGVDSADQSKMGTLLGIKLSINEHMAFLRLKEWLEQGEMIKGSRTHQLATFALTGFANFASVGIQLGGIGAMAPNRRHDLARLGMKALFVGFVATLLNASVAGALSDLVK